MSFKLFQISDANKDASEEEKVKHRSEAQAAFQVWALNKIV